MRVRCRWALTSLVIALVASVSPAARADDDDDDGPFDLPPQTGSANIGELLPSRTGPDGEPLTSEGEVIFETESADTIRPEGEDPPVAPMVPPPAPEDPPLRPQHRVEYNNTLGARYNPLGVVDRLDLFYRYRLYEKPGALYRDASIGIGLTPRASPALARIGPTIEFRPLTILNFQVGYHLIGHFGTFDTLQTFGSPLDDHRDATREALTEAGESRTAIGGELQVLGQFLIKAGNVVLRDTLNVFVSNHNLPEDEPNFWDVRLDIMRSNGRPTFANDLDLVYLTDFGLISGARFTVVHHLHGADDFRPGEARENPNELFRLGPIFAYRFDDVDPTFRAPTVLLLPSWHIKHRWRTGVEFAPMLPSISLAFVFSGDVWNSDVGWAGAQEDPEG